MALVMPFLHSNGIRLAYERAGTGDPVLLVMGQSAAARSWSVYQTPALQQAGYETVVFDNRGMAPSDAPVGRYSIADMVADTKGVIEALDLAPCRIVGTSLGSTVAQELALAHPELVRCAVLLATSARSDVYRTAMTRASRALRDSGVTLPAECRAAKSVLEMLSPATLDDEIMVAQWLEVFQLADDDPAPGQSWVDPGDRRAALREVAVPCRVIAFADDVMSPPHLGAEVADAIPDCDLVEISRCGHLGHLERPAEVNAAIIEFLDKN
ncbi:alpha/beta fold hydrolase [Kutzneria sp. 744]|uniref:alpha/beta fold hydrolase n=1 Tax=Kutzneria sp. (strain 744) TaxID=345341 RepID=UPI0003EEB5F9|nr:alpha/beta hydrolase [Kutzneria sp. 744]EWM10371.1 bromoperoxidase [Kutzneria sp. 744]